MGYDHDRGDVDDHPRYDHGRIDVSTIDKRDQYVPVHDNCAICAADVDPRILPRPAPTVGLAELLKLRAAYTDARARADAQFHVDPDILTTAKALVAALNNT